MYSYKPDRRCSNGYRLVSVRVHASMRKEEMEVIVAAFKRTNPGWRYDCFPTTKTVKNLMTGADVVIAHDTPRSCDPSSELYWSM